MELPKNITQIGEVGKDCKVYVEDYVISYMKQLNEIAVDKNVAVALYGKRREEDGVTYFFFYGACKVNSLQREVRHLSQAQRQEFEGLRRKYFPEYTFLGYRLLNGEMVEGFHICEQEICRYIPGYAQFYEKNDQMLAYMLDMRDEAEPERVDQEKYEEVKKRQEERRAASKGVERKPHAARAVRAPQKQSAVRLRGMRMAAVGVFALLGLLGLATLRDDGQDSGGKDLQATAGRWLEQLKGVDLPETSAGTVAVNAGAQKDTLMLEDKLEQALLDENQQAQAGRPADGQDQADQAQDGQDADVQVQEGQSQEDPVQNDPKTDSSNQDSQETGAAAQGGQGTVGTDQPSAVAYVVRKGDTLTRISIRQYGNDTRVSDICRQNKISDPDDIKVGQIIMLPR